MIQHSHILDRITIKKETTEEWNFLRIYYGVVSNVLCPKLV